MKFIFTILIVLIIFVLLTQVMILVWKVIVGKTIANNTQAFSYTPTNPSSRILVIGDSTALGTGAENPEVSTAGYFHQDFPNAEIVNISRNGAKADDLKKMIKQAEGKFDLVLVQGGANNIIYFTPLEKTKKDITELLQEAKKYSQNVVWLTSGNIGAAPIFMPPISWIYTYQSKRYLAEFAKIAQEQNVARVDLYLEKEDDIFSQNPGKYYAKDQLHLTGIGYKTWYDQIRETMVENNINL